MIHLGFEFWWAFHSQLRSSLARRCNRIHREVAERYTVCLLGRHVSTLHSTHHISTFRLFRQGFCPSVCTSVRSTDIDMSWTCPTCRKRDLQWYILIYFEPTSAVDFFWSKFSDGLQGSSWLQASGTWRTGCFLTQAWRRLKLSEKSKNAIYDFINLWHCIAKTWRQTLFNVAKAHCSQTSSFRVKMCKSWKNMEMRKAYKSNDKQQIVRGLRHRETFDVSSTCSCNPKTARSRRMSLAKIQYGCAETNWAFRSFKLSSEPWSFGEPVFGKLSTFLGRS